MRFLLLLLSITICTGLNSQTIHSHSSIDFRSQKYLSFNPFSLAEGSMAIGAGFGNRFSPRSEYFSELSYLAKSPLYPDYVNSLNGFRVIGQYRYHYSPPALRARAREGAEHFFGFEFRLKQYYFADSLGFVKVPTHDTLLNYPYHATATILGGAILIGVSQNISANERWRFEFTFGLGIKQKLVKFNRVPEGYEPIIIRPVEWGFVPKIYESRTTVYIPSALRIQYRIR